MGLDQCIKGCDGKANKTLSACCGTNIKKLSVLDECKATKGEEGHDNWEDCSVYGKCKNETECFFKNKWYAACMKTCATDLEGNNSWDCTEFNTESDTVDFNCAEDHENCGKYGKCCQTAGKTCYVKEDWGTGLWASCRTTGTCEAGKPYEKDPPEHQTNWNCTSLEV